MGSPYNAALRGEQLDEKGTASIMPDNGICERFHKTAERVLSIEYHESRPHQGRWCFGKTPMQTFFGALPMTKEKMIAA